MKFSVIQFSILLITLFTVAYCSQAQSLSSGIHVFGASDSLAKIEVQAVYFLPQDRRPLPDWKDRIQYYMDRAKKFHQRELCGQSVLNYAIYPSPFVSAVQQNKFPKDDPNNFYWAIINEVVSSNRIRFTPGQLPILVVFSDHNFSPGYDDWSRECNGTGCPFPAPHSECKGYVLSNGDDRPGTRAGGARSVFWPEKHIGLGLVTADGWRVPLKGCDCVVYHEGLGHAFGLPHPEPIDNSVMGLAQYVDSIQKTWINDKQKESLGWSKQEIKKDDLFSLFDVNHFPLKPSANDTIRITASFPGQYLAFHIEAEYQDDLWKPFVSLGKGKFQILKDQINLIWDLPKLPKGMSLSYRVKISSPQGNSDEIWHYVKNR